MQFISLVNKLNFKKISCRSAYTVRKVYRISRRQPGCHWSNSLWAVIISLFPSRESLVSDIPDEEGKIDNLFFTVSIPFWASWGWGEEGRGRRVFSRRSTRARARSSTTRWPAPPGHAPCSRRLASVTRTWEMSTRAFLIRSHQHREIIHTEENPGPSHIIPTNVSLMFVCYCSRRLAKLRTRNLFFWGGGRIWALENPLCVLFLYGVQSQLSTNDVL